MPNLNDLSEGGELWQQNVSAVPKGFAELAAVRMHFHMMSMRQRAAMRRRHGFHRQKL